MKTKYKSFDKYLQDYVFAYAYSHNQAKALLIKRLLSINGKYSIGEIVKC